jgi:serine/threonine-protein kinase
MELVRRTVIGPYEMVAHLDSGGMADVYLACGEDPLQLQVVKIMREELKLQPELVAMFQREGRLMERLDHPHVVRVEAQGEHRGCPWIAMEYLAGDHLGVLGRAARRRRQNLPPALVARLGLAAAAGLAYIHAARDDRGRSLHLIHRDISPHNILLCYDGRVKILDFGVAKSAAQTEATRTGVLKGKLRYLSPEQIHHRALDGRADIFALGIVLWELLSGRRLYRGKSDYETLQQICERPAPPLRAIRPQLDEGLESIVARCLERDRERRWPDAGELASALESYLQAAPAAGQLAAAARDWLDDRRRRKELLLERLRRDGELQLHLFGDLGDGLDETGSQELDLKPEAAGSAPDRIRARSSALEPGGPSAAADRAEPADAAGPRNTGRIRRRRWPLLVALLAVLGLAGLGTAFWVRPAWLTADPPQPASGPRAPQGVMSTEQPLPGRIRRARLTLRCDRPVQVFAGRRRLGPSPLRRIRLAPGQHHLRLVDPASGAERELAVELAPGRHTQLRVVF